MPDSSSTHLSQSETVRVDVGATVYIDIRDHEGVVGRYVRGEESHPYGLGTSREIYAHLAYNAVANGVEQANRLDGWADLEDGAATMSVHDLETDVRDA